MLKTAAALEIVDGPVKGTGRVEIVRNGLRGTVCDDLWDNNDATVVCKMVGYRYVDTKQAAFRLVTAKVYRCVGMKQGAFRLVTTKAYRCVGMKQGVFRLVKAKAYRCVGMNQGAFRLVKAKANRYVGMNQSV